MSAFQSPLEQAKSFIVKGAVDDAILKLMDVLNVEFFHDEALYLLGGCLLDKGSIGLAAVVLSAAIDARGSKNKQFPEAVVNLGACYKMAFKNATAERIWNDALNIETVPKERSKIFSNISGLYINEGNPDRAIHYADLALRADPHNYGVMVNRGLACLELGRWREGWRGLNYTTLSGDAVKRTYPGVPEWDGSPGKVVIVYGDQGVGDEIYFSDCLRDMQSMCKRVIFDCHPRLEALFRRSFPEIEVHGTRKHLTLVDWLSDSGADASVCLSALPERFRADGVWSGDPWLIAEKMGRSDDRLRIGISWTGGTKRTHKHLRSIGISQLAPILRARPDAQWFSLQYTVDAAREVCELEEETGLRISHFPGFVECFDYDKTASFVNSLDLIITVCTTVHHLGGALGVPTWTLVPSRPNWRYCGNMGETLPWYNSARLFRQEKDGDWSAPIARIAMALDKESLWK